jgi:transmembrane sensor
MGRWDVEVIGTRFTLARSPERLRVDVERGLVRVESDDAAPRLLGAGAFAVLSLTPVPSPEPAEIDPIVASPSPATSPPTRAPRRAPWRARADAGDPHGAYALLRTRFPAEVRAVRDVDALFALADVARLSGHPEAAVQPLRRIVDEFPRNPRAAVAAFTLGLLHGDALGHPAEAARAFEHARALGLPADLRESAAARRLAMWTRANRAEEARAAACDYLAEHPDGPAHADAQATCAH